MTLPRISHSNVHWYPYPDLGSYFRLKSGVLFQRPMLQDGAISTGGALEVDWHRGVSEADAPRLQTIVKELENRI